MTLSGSGDTGTGQVRILAGLSAGEQVVVEGPDDLSDGDGVRVR